MSLQRPKNVAMDPRTAPQVVEYNGKRYMAVARGTVDGQRAVLLAGSTSWWVPESDIR